MRKESSTPLFNALWDAGQLASEAFALQICGTSIDYYGYLTVGGYAKDHVDGTVAWLDLQKYRGEWTYYLVEFSSLAVGGDELDFSASTLGGIIGAAIIDSGTTEIILPSSVLGSTSDSGTVLGDLYSGYTGSMSNEELKVVFDKLDKGGTGTISAEDVHKLAQQLGLPFSREEVEKMVMKVDRKGTGRISFSQFHDIMVKPK